MRLKFLMTLDNFFFYLNIPHVGFVCSFFVIRCRLYVLPETTQKTIHNGPRVANNSVMCIVDNTWWLGVHLSHLSLTFSIWTSRTITSFWEHDLDTSHKWKHFQAHISSPKILTLTYLWSCWSWKCRYLYDWWLFFLVSANCRALAHGESDEQNRARRFRM